MSTVREEVVEVAARAIAQATNNELNLIVQAIKNRRAHLVRQTVYRASIGDAVWFRTRSGEKLRGYVHKINRTTIDVMVDRVWRVHASLIRPMSDGGL